jgi:hypothetical protein
MPPGLTCYRRFAEAAAARLGLRVLTLRQRNGLTAYALWPEDGYAWELADPPVLGTWAEVHRTLWLITYRGHCHGD